MSVSEYWECLVESVNAVEMNTASAVLRLVVSMLLGAFVGMERKRKGQMAGIRTFALISMGATLAMVLSVYIPQEYIGVKNGDPGRVAAQVITGIGFLGGGAMIHMKGAVKGLTTAAGIWMTAIIGMAVGIGMYVISILATLMILLTLITFEHYEKRRRMGQESKVIGLTVNSIITDVKPYKEVFNKHNVHLSTYFLEYNYDQQTTEINFVVLTHSYSNLLPMLEQVSRVLPSKKLTLSSQLDI